MNRLVFRVAEEDEGIRADRFLAEECGDFSRNRLQKLIEQGNLLINGKTAKSSTGIKRGDRIELNIPEIAETEILAEDIPLDIFYEDNNLIVVNKPKGMVVHPAPGHAEGTLVNALLYHCGDLSGINGTLRPGIVHRIDKDTSGLIVCAKNDFAHNFLAAQFEAHSINRKYKAIVCGSFKETEGIIDAPIGRNPKNRKLMAVNSKNGKKAVTHYSVLESLGKYSFIECRLETGRTHQIRVHMKSINHPLLGDSAYGGRQSEFKLHGTELGGQTLHAFLLGFIHPETKEYMEFNSGLPEYFDDLLDVLRLRS